MATQTSTRRLRSITGSAIQTRFRRGKRSMFHRSSEQCEMEKGPPERPFSACEGTGLVVDLHGLDLIGGDWQGELAVNNGKRTAFGLLHQVDESGRLCSSGNRERDFVGIAAPLKKAGDE